MCSRENAALEDVHPLGTASGQTLITTQRPIRDLVRTPAGGLNCQMPRPISSLGWRSKRAAAIARIISRVSGAEPEIETLKTIALLCGPGLFLSLLFASYGLDLSAGFF